MAISESELEGIVYFRSVKISAIGSQKGSHEDEEVNVGNQNGCCGENRAILDGGSKCRTVRGAHSYAQLEGNLRFKWLIYIHY